MCCLTHVCLILECVFFHKQNELLVTLCLIMFLCSCPLQIMGPYLDCRFDDHSL